MKIKYITALIVFLCFGIVYFLGWSRDKEDLLITSESLTVQTSVELQAEKAIDMEPEPVGVIFVYVCGYVNNPGVYELSSDARMYEAVDMAGGASEQGCIQYMEMAQNLYDGQRIYVPSHEEAESITVLDKVSGNSSGLVNINTAGKEQLMELPGIGEAKAEAIINYRIEVGNFTRIEDVMNISGIKEAAFNRMKEYICVN